MRLIEREGGFVTGRIALRRRGGGVIDLMSADEPTLRHVRGNEISMVFQEPMTSLNPVLTIGVQIAENVLRHKGGGWPAARDRAQAMLDLAVARFQRGDMTFMYLSDIDLQCHMLWRQKEIIFHQKMTTVCQSCAYEARSIAAN
jgi:ABC-type dipeptide/oligopeptide/nickel transport system ATPase component